MSEQTEKLSSPLGVLPEPEHNAFETIFYKNHHVLGWVLSALGSATRVISGTINASQIQGLKVLFNLSDGTREVISFPNTDISVGENRKIYYADYVTETILSVELPGFEDFIPDENEFPIVHAVRYQDTAVTTADRLEWIAPRTDIYAHVPIGKIIALHPYAPAPDSYFFKFCDGTGTLGNNFPGHEADAIPNLTDGRFLMGGTAYGVGGSNVLLDHTHGHALSLSNTAFSGASGSISGTAATDGAHTHASVDGQYFMTSYNGANQAIGFTWGGNYLTANYYYTASGGNHSHSVSGTCSGISGNLTSGAVSGSVGSGNAPGSTSSLPQYFTAIFYIKVN